MTKGLLCSEWEVRALLRGATQLRRALPFTDPDRAQLLSFKDGEATFGDSIPDDPVPLDVRCPFGKAGGSIIVREAWATSAGADDHAAWKVDGRGYPIWYDADGAVVYTGAKQGGPSFMTRGRRRPSSHMPLWAARLRLDITQVRVQRLHEATEQDAIAEGVRLIDGLAHRYETDTPHLLELQRRWQDEDRHRCGLGWFLNPWVWVASFAVVKIEPNYTRAVSYRRSVSAQA